MTKAARIACRLPLGAAGIRCRLPWKDEEGDTDTGPRGRSAVAPSTAGEGRPVAIGTKLGTGFGTGTGSRTEGADVVGTWSTCSKRPGAAPFAGADGVGPV